MKANELRIGNIVSMAVGSEDNYITRAIQPSEFLAVYKYPNWVNPIPLSEEILLKCGFEKAKGGWYSLNLINEWTYIYFTPKHGVAELSINKHGAILSDQCKHLHQLQNLYFALTGQELNTSGL